MQIDAPLPAPVVDLETALRVKLRLVKRSGETHILAACPVHKKGQERNPSFSVNLDTGGYNCFSCKIFGDFESLKKLLRDPLTGIVITPGKRVALVTNDIVKEMVLELFKQCPLQMLADGFEEKVLLDHEVGYDDIYDRVTFPIRNREGRLVAISGRAADGVEPRYRVYTGKMMRGAVDDEYSPRSKEHIYCGHLIQPGARNVIVAEGYKACLWLRQHGYTNAVATMGTMVTRAQIEHLRRLGDRAIIMFDMDDSGRQAGKDVQKRLLEKGKPAIVISYNSKQPDGLTQSQLDELLSKYKP